MTNVTIKLTFCLILVWLLQNWKLSRQKILQTNLKHFTGNTKVLETSLKPVFQQKKFHATKQVKVSHKLVNTNDKFENNNTANTASFFDTSGQ